MEWQADCPTVPLANATNPARTPTIQDIELDNHHIVINPGFIFTDYISFFGFPSGQPWISFWSMGMSSHTHSP